MATARDMTEQEWLTSTRSIGWMNHTIRDGHAPLSRILSRKQICRKRRLYDCACLRRFWEVIPGPSREAIIAFEELADGTKRWADVSSLSSKLDATELSSAIRTLISRDRNWRIDSLILQTVVPGSEWSLLGKFKGSRVEEELHQCNLLRDIFGNPFRPITIDPRWLTSSVVDLAGAIYEERGFEKMPILADALMDAGCDSEEIISHCRSDGPHVRGCWVVDLLTGRK